MAGQLQLLDPVPEWRLDDETREAGRRGLAAARAALRDARRAAAAAEAERAASRGAAA